MKTTTICFRSLFQAAALFAITVPLIAQTAAPASASAKNALPAAERAPANLVFELPRFKSHWKAGDPRPIAASKVTIDDLSTQGAVGAKAATKQNIAYVTVDGDKDYKRPIRGLASDTTYVSFLVYASEGTTIDIGGATLVIKLNPSNPGFAQLYFQQGTGKDAELHPLPEHIKLEQHDKATLAGLPHLTVRLDPAAHVWDLYSFNRLVESDLPLPVSRGSGARQFSLRAGKEGAMIMSLISADENPIFEDANNNGIDDKFEKQKRLALLDSDYTAAERTKLAQEWKAAQATNPMKPWSIRRPLPDGAPTAPPK